MSGTANPPVELPWLKSAEDSYSDFMSVVERGQMGLKTGFKRLDDALNGLQPGFHIIAGEANCGKTFLIGQLSWQISTHNKMIHVMDVTLDDTKTERLFRLVAHLTGIPTNLIKKVGPQREQYLSTFNTVKQTVDYLKSMVMSHEILDNAEAGVLHEFCELIRSRRADLLSINPDYQLAVFVDSFHDIISTEKHTSDTNRYDYMAQTLSDLANQLQIPIVCTAELRKLNGIRRPTLDDIRESVKIRYEAKSVILAYNDVSNKGEEADVFWHRQGDLIKFPVLELHVAKNKFGSFKGRICLEFAPEVAFMREPDDVTHRKYLDIIHTKK